jgi:hypothetical protein
MFRYNACLNFSIGKHWVLECCLAFYTGLFVNGKKYLMMETGRNSDGVV